MGETGGLTAVSDSRRQDRQVFVEVKEMVL